MSLSVGSLFSGIGGLDLGLERAGMRVVWQSEIDPYASAVLKKHWPAVPNLGDVCRVKWKASHRVDVICGGFPCQDISVAGKGAGIDGPQSSLWREFHRAVCALRPRYAVVENVSALLGRGFGSVLGGLAEIGYDAEWHCIRAADVGAPHRRDRVFIVAYADGEGCVERRKQNSHAQQGLQEAPYRNNVGGLRAHTALGVFSNAAGVGVERRRSARQQKSQDAAAEKVPRRNSAGVGAGHWNAEPRVGRVVDGLPSRVDRIRCLGNAVVPQIAEVIGRAILHREMLRG